MRFESYMYLTEGVNADLQVLIILRLFDQNNCLQVKMFIK